jgi:hypothetical protein
MRKLYKNLKNKRVFFSLFVFTIIAFLIGYFIYINLFNNKNLSSFSSAKNLNAYADKIIKNCSDYPLHQSCYDKEIPLLMENPYNLSMNDAFNVTSIVQKKDPTYWYCHILAHELSAKAIDKNPNNWTNVIDSCPVDMCGSGCMHGAFQEHFKNYGKLSQSQVKEVNSVLNTVCNTRTNWNPSIFNQYNCYHGIGHITMYLTNANIKDSLNTCDQVTVKNGRGNFLQTCYEGVFMQLYQPREPDDLALVKKIQPKKADLTTFCMQFSGEARNTCWRESWVMNASQIQTAQGILEFCSSNILDESGKKECLDKMIGSSIITTKVDKQKINSFCQQLPQDLQANCVMTVVATMVQVDKNLINDAISYCNFTASFNQSQACYNMYIYQANYLFKKNSVDAKKMCSLLPANLINRCLNFSSTFNN